MNLPSARLNLRRTGVGLLIGLGLAGCRMSLPAITPEPMPEWKPSVFLTYTPPPATPTMPVTPSATAIQPVRQGTPLPGGSQPVTAANVAQMIQLAGWGQGIPEALAWAPDGSRLALASTQGVTLYAGRSLRPQGSWASPAPLLSLAWAPDGSALAGGGLDGHIYRWAPDGSLLNDMNTQSPVLCLAWSLDGKQLVSGGWDGQMRVWDVASGELLRNLKHAGGVNRLAFLPESGELISWGRTSQPLGWDISQDEPLRKLYIGASPNGLSADALVFSSDGTVMAATQEQRLRLTRSLDNTTVGVLSGFKTPLRAVAVSAGRAATLEDERLTLWLLPGRKLERELPLPAGQRFSLLSFSPDGTTLVAAGDGLLAWDVQSGAESGRILPGGYVASYVQRAAFVTNNRLRLAFTNMRSQELDLKSGALLSSFQPLPKILPASVSQSADGSLAAGTTGDLKVLLWQPGQEGMLQAFKGHKAAITATAFSPDGRLLASGSDDRSVRLWPLSGGEALATWQIKHSVLALAFSPDGALLAVRTAEGYQIWRSASGELLDTLPGERLTFAGDGQRLAWVAMQNGKQVVRIWDVNSRQVIQTLPTRGSELAFSPTGDLLAVSGPQVTLWQIENGELAHTLTPPTVSGRLAFSPDGRLLLIAGWDGYLSLWGVP